jgi:hypothetical protein
MGGEVDLAGHPRLIRFRRGTRLAHPDHGELGPGMERQLFPDAEGVIAVR